MGRYHINKHGEPAPCQAREGNCPLGEGPGSHFSSLAEAEIATERRFEEKYGILDLIKSSSTDTSQEANIVKSEAREIVDKDENPTSGSMNYGRSIDQEYIMYSKYPESLREHSIMNINSLEKQIEKDYLKKVELVDNIISQSSKFESIYNNKMGEIVEKDVTIIKNDVVEDYARSSISSRIGARISSLFGLSGSEISNEGSLETGRKEASSLSRTETSKGKMKKEDIVENNITAGKNMSLEIEKEENIEIHIDPSVDMIKRIDSRADEKINKDLKKKVEMIRHPEMKEKALSYLEDLSEIQNKNYISDFSRKRVISKFNKANKSGKMEDLVGCNRLIDLIEGKDRDINTYLSSDVNEVTFEENYQRVKDGNMFAVRSQEEINSEIKNVTKNLISCFDY